MNDMVCLGSQHALDIVPNIAQYDAISLGTSTGASFCFERLELKALQNGDRVELCCAVGIIEDGAGQEC